jgi:hypothetical protein
MTDEPKLYVYRGRDIDSTFRWMVYDFDVTDPSNAYYHCYWRDVAFGYTRRGTIRKARKKLQRKSHAAKPYSIVPIDPPSTPDTTTSLTADSAIFIGIIAAVGASPLLDGESALRFVFLGLASMLAYAVNYLDGQEAHRGS